MPLGYAVGDVIKSKRNLLRHTRLHRLRLCCAVAMAEVQHAIGDPRRGTIGVNVVQPHGDLGLRLVGGHGQ